jgi:hypothetical protein
LVRIDGSNSPFDMRALGSFSISFGSGVRLLVSFDMAVWGFHVVRDIGVGLSCVELLHLPSFEMSGLGCRDVVCEGDVSLMGRKCR